MAKKPAAVKLVVEPTTGPALDTAKLQAIAAATIAGGFTYEDSGAPEVQALMVASLVETNPAMVDDNGNVATRATQKGIETVNAVAPAAVETVETVAPAAPVADTGKFVIRSDVPLASIKRGAGARASIFPFDALEVGQSFHVPKTAERPEPLKSLGPTVTKANEKYAKGTGEFEMVNKIIYQTGEDGKRVKVDGHFVKVGEETVKKEVTTQDREFVMRKVSASDPDGEGARIYRIS